MNTFYSSDKESTRFGINVHRAILETISDDEVYGYISDNNVDLLILRVPCEKKNEHYKLYKKDYTVLHADTLVYYFSSLKKMGLLDIRNDLKFVPLSTENQHILNEIIPMIFKDYTNHYFSNPFLDKFNIYEGYVEWAKSYAGKTDSKRLGWLVYSKDQICSFATCSLDDSKKECEGILFGVLPSFSGKGIYTDLIKFTQNYFKEKGFNTMWVSTQIQNYSVQKSWINTGFVFKKAIDTYHIFKKNDTI